MNIIKELWRMLGNFGALYMYCKNFTRNRGPKFLQRICILSDPLIVFKQTNGLRQKEKVKNLEVKFYNPGVQ